VNNESLLRALQGAVDHLLTARQALVIAGRTQDAKLADHAATVARNLIVRTNEAAP
jgi:hypothetical protein